VERLIIIGDIHGCYYELIELTATVKFDKETDMLVFLGDYIDRGKYSYEVVEYIKSLQKESKFVTALKGNHEDMMCKAIETNDNSLWLYNGGGQTKKSYYRNNKPYNVHYNWFKNLPLRIDIAGFDISVAHSAYVNADIVDDSATDYILWDREWIDSVSKKFDKQFVFGHTPHNEVYITPNGSIGIDTGCVFGGKLTACVVTKGTTNENIYNYISINKIKEV